MEFLLSWTVSLNLGLRFEYGVESFLGLFNEIHVYSVIWHRRMKDLNKSQQTRLSSYFRNQYSSKTNWQLL